jgi:hypothetical protein
MSNALAQLRFPGDRSLLPRTKLAYVNLPRLLSDAKRDRSARVSGYVAVWLPDALVILYLKSGDLINATIDTGRSRKAVALSEALGRVPAEPEWGEICFTEAPLELLACMFSAQSTPEIPWPAPHDADGDPMIGLRSSGFNGLVEVTLEGHVNYMMFENGAVAHAYLCGASEKPMVERAARVLSSSQALAGCARCFNLVSELPAQALPPLIGAYRDLMESLVHQLVQAGRASAPAIAEQARVNLLGRHPSLAGFAPVATERFDPVCSARELSRGIAAWATDTVWAGLDIEKGVPQDLFRGLTRERRHMFQSAGFFEHIPWKLEW